MNPDSVLTREQKLTRFQKSLKRKRLSEEERDHLPERRRRNSANAEDIFREGDSLHFLSMEMTNFLARVSCNLK